MEAPHTHRRRRAHSSKSTCGYDPRATAQRAWKTSARLVHGSGSSRSVHRRRKPEHGPGGQRGLAHAYGEGRPDAGHSTDEPSEGGQTRRTDAT